MFIMNQFLDILVHRSKRSMVTQLWSEGAYDVMVISKKMNLVNQVQILGVADWVSLRIKAIVNRHEPKISLPGSGENSRAGWAF